MKDNAPLAGLELFASSLYYDLGKGRISTATALERCLDRLRAQERELSAATPLVDMDVSKLVDRFLGWKLPKDFYPDCGISFKPPNHPNSWPVGTNLLTADQARQMFEYVLQGTTAPSSTEPMNMPLMWLYTHCIAIGMTEKSDSGKPEDDIALFTIHLNDAAKKAASATGEKKP